MSIWTRIADALSSLTTGSSLAEMLEKLRAPPERSVAFTIATIALGAKMAKADGQVTRDEVAAFRQVFHIPPSEEAHAARVYNLARQDVAGFDEYARRVARMFGDGDRMLSDLLEGLFHIAVADGAYHPGENDFLEEVADIFGVGQRQFRAIRTRFVSDAEPDPYDVLGVDPDQPTQAIRAAWRQIVRDCHPDTAMARGLPEEAVRLSEQRLIAANRAWETIAAARS